MRLVSLILLFAASSLCLNLLAEEPAADSQPANQSPTVKHQPQGLAGVGLTPEQVNAAIEKGAKFLWKHLKTEDLDEEGKIKENGENILSFLALVHADAQHRIPEFNAAFSEFMSGIELQRHAYTDGLICMLVESYKGSEYFPNMQRSAQYLVEAQGVKGAWTYTDQSDEITASSISHSVPSMSGGRPVNNQSDSSQNRLKRQKKPHPDNDGDNSCSQYALLGLNAASRMGVKAPEDTWRTALALHRDRQCEEGGFNYHEGGQGSYGSMTCAGICALAICRYELGEKNPFSDPAIKKAVRWLDKNFSITENPNESNWYFYYLYGLERVGRILDTEFIGKHEWYPLGAAQLVKTQKDDGSWVGEGEEKDPRLATSFALLFLTRATPTLRREVKRGGKGTLQAACIPPAMRLYIILDASGSMLAEMNGQQKFNIARNAVAEVVKELPAGSTVGLRVYGHRKTAIDEGADQDTELLIPMAPLDFQQFNATIKPLKARGKTPLAQSITDTVADLGGGEDNEGQASTTVILLTDGGEDTQARLDPVKAAKALGELKNIRFYVVGFDVAGREDWARQLQGIAQGGHGRYLSAAHADALKREIRGAVLGAPDSFMVMDMAGHEIAKGHFDEKVLLQEGQYMFRTDFAGQKYEESFWINTEETTAILFDASQFQSPQSGRTPPEPQKADEKSDATEMGSPSSTSPASLPQQEPKTKFCTSCGDQLKPGSKFCTNCGAAMK